MSDAIARPEQVTETVRFLASPELIQQLRDWSKPVQVRITPAGNNASWEMEIRDPLGLTEEQRLRSDIAKMGEDLIANFRRNMAALDSMPDGTKVKCPCCGLMLPIEVVR